MTYKGLQSIPLAVAAVGMSVLLAPRAVSAASITEYFNDYGTGAASNLNPKNGGTGWSTTWAGNTNTKYLPGTQVTYTATGYASTGNQSDANDGAAYNADTASLSYRQFTGLTGTIWLSAVVTQAAGGQDALLWLDKTSTAINSADRDFIALRGSAGTTGDNTPEAVIAYNGTDDTSSSVNFFSGSSHLLLARIDMNFSGTFDQIRYWVDPDLSTGEAGLGLNLGDPNGPLYVKNTLDAYGGTFDGLGYSGNAVGTLIDALRISNDPDGFTFVTTGESAVPEPASIGLLGVLATSLLARRRRSA